MPPDGRSRTPHRLLTTLLGDYWLESDVMVPSAAWVELISEFGVSSAATRAALARSARREVLATEKYGRNTFYGVTPATRERLREGARRILTFGQVSEVWDGKWTVVAFSLTDADRSLRHSLTSRLRWIGFAPLYDGLWVSPRVSTQVATETLLDLQVRTASVLRAVEADMAFELRRMLTAWDLEDIHHSYQSFLANYRGMLDDIRSGSVEPSAALVARTTIMDDFRRFHRMDPKLPGREMPSGWLRREAVETFCEIYNSLGVPALQRIRGIVGRHSSEAAEAIRMHSVEEAADWNSG